MRTVICRKSGKGESREYLRCLENCTNWTLLLGQMVV